MDQNERANDETLTDFKPINPSVNIDRIRTPDHEHAHPDIVEIAEINHVAANQTCEEFWNNDGSETFIRD